MAEDLLSYALMTLADLKTAMNISASTYDNLLTQGINDATMLLERKCHNRRFKSTAYTNDRYDGNDEKLLFLRNYPISSVTSVTVDGDTVTAASDYNDYDSYWVEPIINGVKIEGALYMSDTWALGEQNVVVSFTGGYSTIPYDLRRLCTLINRNWYNLALNDKGFKSENIGRYSYSFAPFPPEIEAEIDKLIAPFIPGGYF